MPIRIGVVFEDDIASGGGFQQSRSALEQICRIWRTEDITVFASNNATRVELCKSGYVVVPLRVCLKDKLFGALASNSVGIWLLQKFGLVSPVERLIRNERVSLVYYLSPSALPWAVWGLPFIYTVWDLCHRDAPWFPEVIAGGEFRRREIQFQQLLPQAALILVDSDDLAEKVTDRYGLDREKILVMPFFPSRKRGLVDSRDPESSKTVVAGDNFFFYPAQFWPHKNHIRIVEALHFLKTQGTYIRVVFSGGDRGLLKTVLNYAASLGVDDQIESLGFVSDEKIQELYERCFAVIMPTYFGPTNLPPIEGWLSSKPVIYTENLVKAWDEFIVGVNPDSAKSIGLAMAELLRADSYSAAVRRGHAGLKYICDARALAEKEFQKNLGRLDMQILNLTGIGGRT